MLCNVMFYARLCDTNAIYCFWTPPIDYGTFSDQIIQVLTKNEEIEDQDRRNWRPRSTNLDSEQQTKNCLDLPGSVEKGNLVKF